MATSYTFSISYQTGCYRHIRISSEAKLVSLHRAIVEAFGLSDGHMHAFFMNNTAWDNTKGYYCTGYPDSKNPATDEVRLRDFEIRENGKFLYIYDFRSEHRFTVKLLRKSEEETQKPVLVRSVGELFLNDRHVQESAHELPKASGRTYPTGKWELVHLYACAAANLYGFVSLPTFCKIFNGHQEEKIKPKETEEYLLKRAGEEYEIVEGFLVFPAGENTPELLKDLLKDAHGKPRYVPADSGSFLKYLDVFYTDTPEITEKIKTYLKARFGAYQAEELLHHFLHMLRLDYPVQEFMEMFSFSQTPEEDGALFPLVVEAKNASRIWKNKGFTPVEQLRMERASARVLTKVGRNDLCPCGSGKKYKKCCGR